VVPEPAAEKGFKIERKYYTLAGKPADPAKAKQNDRFAVVLRITEPQAAVRAAHRRRLSARRLRDRQSAAGVVGRYRHARLDRRRTGAGEFRIPRRPLQRGFRPQSGDPSVFTVAYVVRAVSPGRYVHPQAFVEDMYRPDRFGRTATGTVEVTGGEMRNGRNARRSGRADCGAML
jgi:hypothetical protein